MAKTIFRASLRVFKEKAKARMNEAAELLKDKIIENASLTDHTLKQLAAMGHPYSVRDPRNPHNPPYQIHTQTGDLKDNIEVSTSPKGFRISVGVDEDKVFYIPYIINGTRVMIARDFITGSFDEILPEMQKVFKRK